VQELVVVSRDLLHSLPGEEEVFARVAVQESISGLLTNLFVVGPSVIVDCAYFRLVMHSRFADAPRAAASLLRVCFFLRGVRD